MTSGPSCWEPGVMQSTDLRTPAEAPLGSVVDGSDTSERGTKRMARCASPAYYRANAGLLYSAELRSDRPGQTCVSMPLTHMTTGGQGVVGSNPAVPTQVRGHIHRWDVPSLGN
jgi:hypothetical protein